MTKAPEIQTAPHLTFGINQTFTTFDSGWRTFRGHYLLYASQGAFQLEVEHVQWLLPPHRAAWVSAQVPLRVRVDGPVTSSSVLFAESFLAPPPFDCRVFALSLLAREMIRYAMRWGSDRKPTDDVADTFFRALAHVCLELAADPDQFWLPRARSPELIAAMDYTVNHLTAHPTFAEAARAASVSERTLARRFIEETTMTWSQFLQRARMIRAMERLAEPNIKVIDVSADAGFDSVSAFNRAFRQFTGETPSSYQKRFFATAPTQDALQRHPAQNSVDQPPR
jgi:AraC-like DNA-binding protein